MRRIEWMLSFGLALLLCALFAVSAHAAPLNEDLQQMVQQLQQNPADDALRERIIRQAQAMRHAPTVPDAAVEFEGRAQFAFNNAQSKDDYLAAAREYEQAVASAPWVSGYYADLCTIYEKAGKLAEAKRNCEFALIGLVDAAQITPIKRKIAGLKYGMEQGVSKKNQEEDFLRKLDGARFVKRWPRFDYGGGAGWTDWRGVWMVRGGKAYLANVKDATSVESAKEDVGIERWNGGYPITGHEFVIPKDDEQCQGFQQRCFDEVQTISEDGSTVVERTTRRGKLSEVIYLRER